MLISDSTLCLHAEEKLKNNRAGRSYRIVAIETPGGKRNLNIDINAQQAVLKAYIYQNNSSLYKNIFFI